MPIYEEYEENVPVKFFLDLDSKSNIMAWNLKDLEDINVSIKILVKEYFKEVFKVELDTTKILVIESCEFPKIFSLHILCNDNYHFENFASLKLFIFNFIEWIIYKRNLKSEFQTYVDKLFYYDKVENKETCLIDKKVYDNGRCMRTLWCSKILEPKRYLKVYEYEHFGLKDNTSLENFSEEQLLNLFYDSCIQHVIKPNILHFGKEIIIRNKLELQQEILSHDISKETPKEKTKHQYDNKQELKEEEIIIISNWIKDSLFSSSNENLGIELKHNQEKFGLEITPICFFCPIKGQKHKSSKKFSINLVKNPKHKGFQIFTNCWAAKCCEKEDLRKNLSKKLKSNSNFMNIELIMNSLNDKRKQNKNPKTIHPLSKNDNINIIGQKLWISDSNEYYGLVSKEYYDKINFPNTIMSMDFSPFIVIGDAKNGQRETFHFKGEQDLDHLEMFLHSHILFNIKSLISATNLKQAKQAVSQENTLVEISDHIISMISENTIGDESGLKYLYFPKTKLWKPFHIEDYYPFIESAILYILITWMIKSKNATYFYILCKYVEDSSIMKNSVFVDIKRKVSSINPHLHTSKFGLKDHLLPLKNGKIINLKTLEIRDYDKNDHVCNISDLELNPSHFELAKDLDKKENQIAFFENCNLILIPVFEWISDYWNNPSEQLYMHLRIGYTITGSRSLKDVCILLGPSNSGKSKFLEVLNLNMGHFAMNLSPEIMNQKNLTSASAPNPELVKIDMKRLIALPELKEKSNINTHLLKLLTGEEKISARLLHSSVYQDIRIKCKMMLSSNYEPDINYSESSLDNRSTFIKFDKIFSKIPRPEKGELKADDEIINNLKGTGNHDWRDLFGLFAVVGSFMFYNFYNQNISAIYPSSFQSQKQNVKRTKSSVITFIQTKTLLSDPKEKNLDSSWILKKGDLYLAYRDWYINIPYGLYNLKFVDGANFGKEILSNFPIETCNYKGNKCYKGVKLQKTTVNPFDEYYSHLKEDIPDLSSKNVYKIPIDTIIFPEDFEYETI